MMPPLMLLVVLLVVVMLLLEPVGLVGDRAAQDNYRAHEVLSLLM